MRTHNCLQIKYFSGRNLGGIHQGQGSIAGLENLIVAHNGGPLQWEADIFVLPLVKSRVHAMLEIARHRDQRFLLLLCEHFCVFRYGEAFLVPSFPFYCRSGSLLTFLLPALLARDKRRRRRQRQRQSLLAHTLTHAHGHAHAHVHHVHTDTKTSRGTADIATDAIYVICAFN